MSIRSEVEHLRRVPLFADIDPAQLQVLVFSADRLEVAAGDNLFEAGSLIGAGHLVLQGRGEVLGPEGADAEPVALVEPGAFLGELAMIADQPVSVTVRAKSRMRILRIGHVLFLRVCGEFPEVAVKVLDALAARLDASLKDLNEARTYFDRARRFSRS